ncbi:MAG: aminotransferase class I/II-fold pyridoxal phosphate-dependent enzyme [Brachybacterium sp.]|uniref:MalY/PatB family protein n=1 Tax=Brachybacterium sp. TaxID=1891286 RepID=UPI00264737CC|nr:aminotransferase class I/II-fold pyridoxal phosphate-dependent enzyme [Brachybacterium sp.]MDN5685598.1 aminotransferase class I/II-fold pyridoxal phosphate-dependent enzyme [Brachybacterium sp.]
MPSIDELDAITQDELIATGATRWARGDDVIGAFVAEMDFGTAAPITRRLHREVDRGAFGYLPAALRAEMQQATAEFLHRRAGWTVDPADIHEMPDVISVYEAVLDHFLAPGTKLIVPTPAYMPFLQVPDLHDREILEVEMLADDAGRYHYDLDALEAAFDAGGELLVLCNPHNPTGRVFSREEMESLVELVDRKGGRVFSDEIWMPLVLQGEHIPYATLSETAAGHTITAVAASKAFNLPGLKCAQMITSNDADRVHWAEVGHFPMHAAANLGLAAASAAYGDGMDWLEDVVTYLRRNRETLTEMVARLLPKARITTLEGTYVAWVDLRGYGITGSLHDHLLEHARVECTDGTACGRSWEGYIRFIYAMPHPLLVEAITRIARALEPGRAST